MLWRCLRWPGQVVRYGAQTGMDARAMLADTWWPRLEHSPLAEVLSFRRQSGHEALIFENTSRLGLLASTEKSAHGSTLDMAVLDESWAHADHRLEQSCRPAMVTRDNAQMLVVSTAGTEQRSPFLWEKVQTGRQATEAGVTEGIAYLEWSADPESDPGDPQGWRQAIPAMGVTMTRRRCAATSTGCRGTSSSAAS
jgi:phage terminase large subunit-like protein